jgi:hypothetical protein
MNWLELLKKKVEELGRRKVEQDTGMSKTTLSLVLNNKYMGSISNIESQVNLAYAKIEVECPVLGKIRMIRCVTEQKKPLTLSNPQRIKLFKACAICPNNKANK